MNIDEIIDQIFQDILDYLQKKEISYSEFGEFISRTASLLEELGNTYSCDFSEDNSGGARLMAKILFLKFPKELKGEMIGLTRKRILSLSSILELTGEAIKRLQVKIVTSADSSLDTGRISSQGVARRPKNTSSFHIDTIPFQKNCMWPLSSVILVPQRREGSCLKLQNYSIHYLSASLLQSEAVFFLGLCGGNSLVGMILFPLRF